MMDKEPNEEQNSERPLEEALPTQQMPEDAIPGVDATDQLRIISFYLPSRSEPIITSDNVITLGRRDPKRGINPTVDLTEERGAHLGVSRLHAEINVQKGRYFIKDMGSSNGTWVNNSKLVPYQLHPVETGDQIRLGQLAILVHITLPQRGARSTTGQKLLEAIADSDFTFRLTTRSKVSLVQAQGGFAPVLLETVGNMLKNLEKVYYIVREAQEQEASGFSVIRIRTEALEGALLVDVKGGVDVLDFLIEKMPKFVKVLEGGEAISMTTPMEEAIEAAHIDQYDTIPEQVAEYALQELVYRFLHEQRKQYVQQLAPYLEDILSSTLVLEKIAE